MKEKEKKIRKKTIDESKNQNENRFNGTLNESQFKINVVTGMCMYV